MSTKTSYPDALEKVYMGQLPRKNGYIEIPTSLFVEKVDVDMPTLPPIGFYSFTDEALELLKPPDQPMSPLVLSLHNTIWIKEQDEEPLRKFAESVLLNPGGSSSTLPSEKRMEILRRSAITIVEDLFQEPTEEKITKSVHVVRSFVYLLMKDPKAYLLLIRLSSHDPYTLQHSVGTAVNAIILGRKLGISQERELLDLGLAGLLHDIGKVRVRKEIINKAGPLTEGEWEEMRQHSREGYEIVKNNPQIADRAKRAILEHHEDNIGTGYPAGLKADQIDFYSKIITMCDIFNALTNQRAYAKARPVFEAFQFIKDKLMHKVDEEIFTQLVLVYGGKLEELAAN